LNSKKSINPVKLPGSFANGVHDHQELVRGEGVKTDLSSSDIYPFHAELKFTEPTPGSIRRQHDQ